MNFDVENIILQRYKQVKFRLQSELKDILRVRMENLDEVYFLLEYVRERYFIYVFIQKVINGICIFQVRYYRSKLFV